MQDLRLLQMLVMGKKEGSRNAFGLQGCGAEACFHSPTSENYFERRTQSGCNSKVDIS
jgi:hypothetical protein